MPPLHPRRSLAAPFLATLFPLLWFLNRETSIRAARDAPIHPLVVTALAVTAVAVSHAVAAAVATRLPDPSSLPELLRPIIAPSNATLALVAAASAATAAYVLAPDSVAFPGWFETLASAFGLLLGWPLLVLIFAAYALGDPLPPDARFAAMTLAVAVGVAISALWLFVLSGWIVGLVADDGHTSA